MLKNFKKYLEENWEVISAGIIALNGGCYFPYAK